MLLNTDQKKPPFGGLIFGYAPDELGSSPPLGGRGSLGSSSPPMGGRGSLGSLGSVPPAAPFPPPPLPPLPAPGVEVEDEEVGDVGEDWGPAPK